MFKASDCMFGARIIKIVNWCQEMLHSRTALDETVKIRGLYCKTESSFLWEEREAIFCTRHEGSFYFIQRKMAKELVQK